MFLFLEILAAIIIPSIVLFTILEIILFIGVAIEKREADKIIEVWRKETQRKMK